MGKKKALFMVCLLAVAFGLTALVALFAEKKEESKGLLCVTSFYPVQLLAESVAEGADGVTVRNLTENHSGCIHDYTLTTQDMRLLSEAELFLINGWHVCDSQPCEATILGRDKAVSISGCDTLIQLPATYVTDVTSVIVAGDVVDYFDFTTDGLLWLYDVCLSRRSRIVINYQAGLTDALAGGVKELIGHRVTHALAQSYGIQSEAAGGESVTYSANWINNARATALPDDNKEALNPYRLRRMF